MKESLEPFPAPGDGQGIDVLFVAGEHSGDEHAALVVRELLEKNPRLRIAALGGPALEEAGAQLLFDLTASSVVGLVEVLRNYGFFKELFARILDWIEQWNPRVVCFVDYPGFNLRLAEALRKRGISRKGGGDVFLYYYISPQIWAWKAKRRFRIAETIDEMGTIFPFEARFYEDTDLELHFVGHPFVAEAHSSRLSVDADGPVLLLPGSRTQPVQRILPTLLDGWMACLKNGVADKAVVLFPSEQIRNQQEAIIARCDDAVQASVTVMPSKEHVAASAALMSSGTMSLNVALAGIPGAIVYRAHPVTYWIGRRLVKIPYLGIANIILDRPMYPEFLQEAAKPEALSERVRECLNDLSVRNQAAEDASELKQQLMAESGESAADRIYRRIEGK